MGTSGSGWATHVVLCDAQVFRPSLWLVPEAPSVEQTVRGRSSLLWAHRGKMEHRVQALCYSRLWGLEPLPHAPQNGLRGGPECLPPWQL